MTHAELVQVAGRWLRNTMHCGVVLLEKPTFSGEIPDALGWTSPLNGSRCILVEVKVSRADFLADLQKPFRAMPQALGRKRWYLTDGILMAPQEVPDGWGLVIWNGKQCRVKTWAQELPEDVMTMDYERKTLLIELRKFQAQGLVYQTAAAFAEAGMIQ